MDEDDEEQRRIEERRKRLQEIKAKHMQQAAATGESNKGVKKWLILKVN